MACRAQEAPGGHLAARVGAAVLVRQLRPAPSPAPREVTSHPWRATRGDGHERLSVLFPKPACACEARQDCTGITEDRSRHIILLPQPLREIQRRVRREQDTLQWRQHCAIRAGCEATVSETVHAHGLRPAATEAWPKPTSSTFSRPSERTSSD